MNCLWNVWNDHPSIVIHETMTLTGFSIAALRTNFYIKELNILFDAGLSGYMSPDHIFITHSHGDHIANIPFHVLNSKPDCKIQIYVPIESVKLIESYMSSLYSANDNSSNKLPSYCNNYQIIGVSPGEKYNLEIKGKKFVVEIIKCYHSVPCVGYGFTEVRQKLKSEYLGFSGKKIKELKDNNVIITENINFHIFCFLGDTSHEVIKENISKYKTIIMECTFINDEEIERANITKHTHWTKIKQFIIDHPTNMFVLYHFSQRYKKDEISAFFDKSLITNIHPWISNP